MRVKIKMRTPNALSGAIERAADDEIGGALASEDLELEEQFKELVFNTKMLAERWFRDGEQVTLILDTDARTCEVEHR